MDNLACPKCGNPTMPSKQKINLEKVQASLNTLCLKCGYVIPPAEICRYDFNTIKCPACGEHFKTNQA